MEVMDFLFIFGAIGLALLAVVTCLRWEPMVFMALTSAMVEVYLGLDVGVELGQQTLRLIDALAVMAAVGALLRLFTVHRLSGPLRWWMLTCVCWGLAALYGASSYGFATALGFYRQHFYLSAVALYLMTFDMTAIDIRRATMMWVGLACIVMVYSVLARFDPALVNEGLISVGRRYSFTAERVVVAGAAMVMGQAALISLGGWSGMRGALLLRILAVLLIVAVFLQYHRTAWLASLVGALAMVRVNMAYLLRLAPVSVLVLACVAVLWLSGLAAGQDFITSAVSQAIREPLDAQQSTTIWRIEGWRILVAEAIGQGPFRILFGGGFGVGYERMIQGVEVIFSPHNMYVEIFLNAGLFGLLPMLGFFASVLHRAMQLRRAGMEPDGFDPAVAVALIVSILVYSFSYSLGYDQGVLIGILAAALGSRNAMPQRTL